MKNNPLRRVNVAFSGPVTWCTRTKWNTLQNCIRNIQPRSSRCTIWIPNPTNICIFTFKIPWILISFEDAKWLFHEPPLGVPIPHTSTFRMAFGCSGQELHDALFRFQIQQTVAFISLNYREIWAVLEGQNGSFGILRLVRLYQMEHFRNCTKIFRQGLYDVTFGFQIRQTFAFSFSKYRKKWDLSEGPNGCIRTPRLVCTYQSKHFAKLYKTFYRQVVLDTLFGFQSSQTFAFLLSKYCEKWALCMV